MEKKMAKGTMLIDYVRMVRTFKDVDWDKYLKPEDWDIVNSIILPAKWYPFDVYYRISMAGYRILSEGKLENARKYGQTVGKQLFEGTYRSMVASKDPDQALKQFVATYGALFNFGVLKLEDGEAKSAKVHISYEGEKDGKLAYAYQLMGILETLLTMTGAQNGQVRLISKQWDGAPTTTYNITWV